MDTYLFLFLVVLWMSIATGGQLDKQKQSHHNHKYDEAIKENEMIESQKSNKNTVNGLMPFFTRTNSSNRNRSHTIIHSHYGSNHSEENVPSLFRFHRKLYPDNQLVALNEMLFPNKTGEAKYKLIRRLGIEKPAYNGSVPCVICRDLTTCSILNGYQIEEVYYPKNLNYLETCKVIESFGKRIEKLVFGNGKTFRDTAQCREMVMQYLCLFYGSDNDMYKNYCIYQEDVKDPNPANHKVAPRPPCKSFCVQIASVCANDPDFFIQTCNNIKCPPTQDECTPDPTLKNKVLAANLGCAVPYYNSPYFRSAASSTIRIGQIAFWITLFMVYNLFSV